MKNIFKGNCYERNNLLKTYRELKPINPKAKEIDQLYVEPLSGVFVDWTGRRMLYQKNIKEYCLYKKGTQNIGEQNIDEKNVQVYTLVPLNGVGLYVSPYWGKDGKINIKINIQWLNKNGGFCEMNVISENLYLRITVSDGGKRIMYKYLDGELVKKIIQKNSLTVSIYYVDKKLTKIINDDGQSISEKYITYHENGNVKEKLYIIDGSITLIEKYYDDGNILSSEQYKNKKLHGESKTFYKDGTLRKLENFANGKKVGNCVIYYENGRVNEKYFVSDDGKYDGDYIIYDINGKILSKKTYEKGKLIYEYRRDNTKVNEIRYTTSDDGDPIEEHTDSISGKIYSKKIHKKGKLIYDYHKDIDGNYREYIKNH